jgi:hypothetical protein
VFFLGDHMRLTVEAFDRQSLTARIPARRARHSLPAITSTLMLYFRLSAA